MDDSLTWHIIFYEECNGNCPITKFFASLSEGDQKKITSALQELRVRNITARRPLIRPLGERLWELRVETRSHSYRLIFVWLDKYIVVLNGFQKTSQRTPRSYLKIAQRRYRDYLKRL